MAVDGWWVVHAHVPALLLLKIHKEEQGAREMWLENLLHFHGRLSFVSQALENLSIIFKSICYAMCNLSRPQRVYERHSIVKLCSFVLECHRSLRAKRTWIVIDFHSEL